MNLQPEEQESDSPEEQWYKDMDRAVTLSLGMKRSGKTYLLMKFLIRAIRENKYDEYHLVLPQYHHERDDKYKWLKYYPNVIVYNAYAKMVSDRVLLAMKTKHVFFGIDDATSELLNNIDASFSRLLTCNEHGKQCAVWLCVHSARKILTPLVRQMINYLFVYKNANRKLMMDIWEEWFSMEIPDFKEFSQMYKQVVYEQDNEALLYSFQGHHSYGIKHFALMNETEPKVPKKKKATKNFVQVDPKQERMKLSVFDQMARSKMKEQYKPAKKPTIARMFGYGK